MSLTINLFFPYKWFGAAVLVFGLDAAPKLFHRLSEAAFFGQAAGGCRVRGNTGEGCGEQFPQPIFYDYPAFQIHKSRSQKL
ncbi:hypothetical protein [Ruminococcus sp.]|uniref:hypothetical protein n=1 Tax=Ruminococcus sp. TaxID=41978 RepID=UPI001B2BC375|nr:hypothetical protein [Ruminococcus sp.]MBO5557650.1 hypothetical protein [Ruminococcus sp.]